MKPVTIHNLRCEYSTNPIGIDAPVPRLAWQLQSGRRAVRQTAYQVLVARTLEALAVDLGDLWDSGKIDSDRSIHVSYEGQSLGSRERAYWKVQVWDESGACSGWSEPAFWETGLLDRADWKAAWVGSPFLGGPRTPSPSPFLRKTFSLAGDIRSARLYVTALGLYEFYINGNRVGEDVFSPGWTDYNKRVQYDVYDVTQQLRSGDNAAGAILGDGWYCGNVAMFGRQFYGDRPKLLAQIVVEFADGRTETIETDGSWRQSSGPILEADLIMGESYDARLEMPGWNETGFDDSQWQGAEIFPDPGMARVARLGPPVRRMGELKPGAPQQAQDPGWLFEGLVFDFGQNMAGRLRLRMRAKRGMTVRIRHGETLARNGVVYRENLRLARAEDFYTFKGDGEETWEPRFTFHGFRYAEIAGIGKFEVLEATGIVLHSSMALTGEFECSNPLVNQLQHNIQWGQRSNFLEAPTDCPQRDERLGWTGDAQVFARTAAFNMDVAAFFTKWQTDIEDAQTPEGMVPAVIPCAKLDFDGGPAWADAAVICPWTIYLCYGDKGLLEKHYASLVRFVGYLESLSRDGIRSHAGCSYTSGFGDWLALDGSGKMEGGTPKELIGTAFFAVSTRLLSRIATILGRKEDASRYESLFETARAAFNREFVTASGRIASGTQTACVLALHFDLLPESLRDVAVEALVRDIRYRKTHLATGFVGTPYLAHVLTRAGKIDIAYELLLQETWPSWLYAVTQGATTIWERWDGWTHDRGFQDSGMNSFNHYAYGAIGDWLYSTVAGIDLDPEAPGYKHVILHPRPGGGLTSARAALDSGYGRIASDWEIRQSEFVWKICVPANSRATVYVPSSPGSVITESGKPVEQSEGLKRLRTEDDSVVFEAGSGEYSFVVKGG